MLPEREIDTHIATAFRPSDDARQIETRIRRVLTVHKPDEERGAPPFVHLSNNRGDRRGSSLLMIDTRRNRRSIYSESAHRPAKTRKTR